MTAVNKGEGVCMPERWTNADFIYAHGLVYEFCKTMLGTDQPSDEEVAMILKDSLMLICKRERGLVH